NTACDCFANTVDGNGLCDSEELDGFRRATRTFRRILDAFQNAAVVTGDVGHFPFRVRPPAATGSFFCVSTRLCLRTSMRPTTWPAFFAAGCAALRVTPW